MIIPSWSFLHQHQHAAQAATPEPVDRDPMVPPGGSSRFWSPFPQQRGFFTAFCEILSFRNEHTKFAGNGQQVINEANVYDPMNGRKQIWVSLDLNNPKNWSYGPLTYKKLLALQLFGTWGVKGILRISEVHIEQQPTTKKNWWMIMLVSPKRKYLEKKGTYSKTLKTNQKKPWK